MRFEAIRQSVVEYSVALADRGYFAATGGNLALRIDAEHIAVTPSATDYYKMGPADVCVLRLADLSRVEGDRNPSVETGLHAQVLRNRRDCHASIHTHQAIASALTLLGKSLPVEDSAPRALLGREVSLVGYAPSGTGWLVRKLGRKLRPDINAYLLRTHGVICCGRSAGETLQAIVALERLAASHLRERIIARAASDTALQRLVATLDSTPILDMIGVET
jgi:L-fuculose-phosphate aldolase